MPLEGHWRRTRTPIRRLTRRERLAVAWGTAATIVAIVVLVVATAGNSRPAPGPGCIRAMIPHVMGASELNLCGEHARRACAQHADETDPGSLSIQASCRKAGIPE